MKSGSDQVVAMAMVGVLVLVGCGGEGDAVPDSTTTLVATTTSSPATSTSVGTTTTSEAGTTTLPTIVVTLPPTSTTALVVTLPPTTAGAATTAPTGPAPSPAPATAFVTDDTRLLEIDVATGTIVRVVSEGFTGDGLFRGALRASPDRQTIWFSEGYEDSWFACDSSIGSYGRVDVGSGAVGLDGIGSDAEPSPDGLRLAYVTSKLCLPDPENPEYWVLTPADRAVVRELAGGAPREFVTATAPDSYDSPDLVRWAGFRPDGELLVLMGDGRLFAVDVDGPSTIQDHPVLVPDVAGFPVGVVGNALITIELGSEGSSDLASVDLATGQAAPLASSEGFMGVGISAGGHIAAVSSSPITVAPGAQVTVIEPADDSFIYDVEW